MRFQRSDLPGFLIALLAPVALTALFFTAYDVWDHEHTPLLGFMAVNIAVVGGLAAAFSRFVRSWDLPFALLAILIGLVAAVIWAQQTGNDGTNLALGLKWGAVIAFLLLNVVMLGQVLTGGLLPILDRRDARRRAADRTE